MGRISDTYFRLKIAINPLPWCVQVQIEEERMRKKAEKKRKCLDKRNKTKV